MAKPLDIRLEGDKIWAYDVNAFKPAKYVKAAIRKLASKEGLQIMYWEGNNDKRWLCAICERVSC